MLMLLFMMLLMHMQISVLTTYYTDDDTGLFAVYVIAAYENHFIIDSHADRCMQSVSGPMPLFWGWLSQASFLGSHYDREYGNIVCMLGYALEITMFLSVLICYSSVVIHPIRQHDHIICLVSLYTSILS